MQPKPTLCALCDIVRAVRPFLLDPAEKGAVTAKNANDFVTAADRGVERRLGAALRAAYPDVTFFSEEQGKSQLDDPRPTFVLDPIDGTTNYIFSFGLSAVSLALVENGAATLGVVYNPFTDELFAAEKGKGAARNGAPIAVSPAARLNETLAIVGTMPYHKERADELFATTRRLYEACIDIRRTGSAALDLCYVAAGRAGVFAERDLQVWDIAAGSLVLAEAGGKLTDFAGAPLRLCGRTDVAASNGALHADLLALLAE